MLLVIILFYLAAERGKILLASWPLKLILLALLWLASQIATDLVRQSEAEDYLRGWANISLFILCFSAIYLLLRADRRIVLYAVGLALSQLIKYFVNPDPMVIDDPWKWGVGLPVTICLVLASTVAYHRRRSLIALAPAALALILNLHYNFRSMALIVFATLSCLLLGRNKYIQKSPLKLAFIVLSLVACGWGFQTLYKYAAANGVLGQAALKKYELQSAGKLGLVLGGRSESLASIPAILDSPILGHGSWARDAYYANILQSARAENGNKSGPVKDDLIPSHSHILGAWIDAGALGAVFWLAVLSLTLRSMRYLLVYPLPLRVFSLFCGFSLLWDIPFSPFGAQRRFTTPLYLLLMIVALRRGQTHHYQASRKRQWSFQRSWMPNKRGEVATSRRVPIW